MCLLVLLELVLSFMSLSRSVGIGSNSQLLDVDFITYLVVSWMLACLNCLTAKIFQQVRHLWWCCWYVCESSLDLEAV